MSAWSDALAGNGSGSSTDSSDSAFHVDDGLDNDDGDDEDYRPTDNVQDDDEDDEDDDDDDDDEDYVDYDHDYIDVDNDGNGNLTADHEMRYGLSLSINGLDDEDTDDDGSPVGESKNTPRRSHERTREDEPSRRLPRVRQHLNIRQISVLPPAFSSRSRLFASFLPNQCNISQHARKAFDSKPYCAQFSQDGSLLYAATQNFEIHLYSPHNAFRHTGTIPAIQGRWTITDCDLSKDNSSLVYSSIHNTIFLVNLTPYLLNSDSYDIGTFDDFSRQTPLQIREDCGVWSVRLSDNGKEVVAGASGGVIVVMDISTNRILHRVDAHQDDVNAVTFADESANILLSGSDDNFLKVWDRRSSLATNKPVGILVGHTEGITFVSTRARDARTVISNGKDQTLKMWDLRKSMASSVDDPETRRAVRVHVGTGYDYRWEQFPFRRSRPHPFDGSVATFKGHSVLRTLIRCHFSPSTTGHRYIYSGSADGNVYIYDPKLHPSGGPPVAVLSTPRSMPNQPSAEEEELRWNYYRRGNLLDFRQTRLQMRRREICVRDVAWNPLLPQIIASVWTGNEGCLESFEYDGR
ncbi:hypothetical protein HDU83_008304 [Entophlyctis luteolus]|nr:hypothetical protein HDU83_008304 [Entophlyctis luteolus]KAJ3387798.1 hypothetical protein HDU84_000538 [Entophlyctis sp. JEL0112]